METMNRSAGLAEVRRDRPGVAAEPDLGGLGEHREVRVLCRGLGQGVPDPAEVDGGIGADRDLAERYTHGVSLDAVPRQAGGRDVMAW